MLATTGNMDQVYREFWRTIDAITSAERDANSAPASSILAEIAPDTEARWYLVRCRPGEDMRALRHLARRRFGVFRPMQQRIVRSEGSVVFAPQFAGWLLVMVWDIDKMATRIHACPGVAGILADPASGRPVAISDTFALKLQQRNWTVSTHAEIIGRRQASRRSRPGHRVRRAQRMIAGGDKVKCDA